MSFTADELQAFNDILDSKLSAHRRDMEQFLEQRLNTFRREVEQRLIAVQQESIRVLTQKLVEQHSKMKSVLQQQLTEQQMHIAQSIHQESRQRREQNMPGTDHIGEIIDRSLAAQLLAIEELLNQRLAFQSLEEVSFPASTMAAVATGEHGPHFDAIEIQTELPWEDLMDVFGKVLDDRFATLGDQAQMSTQQLEHQLSLRFSALQHQLFDELSHLQVHSYSSNLTDMQEVFQSIEQLERLIESMQVAMTANQAVLSNRLFHHQQLPLERAHPAHSSHPGNSAPLQSPDGMSNSLPQPTQPAKE